MLFLIDPLDSEKSEGSLHYSSVSKPIEFEDALFGYHDGEDAITEPHMHFQCGVLLDRAVFHLSSMGTMDHSGDPRKSNMSLNSIGPVIMSEEKKLETF
jgi:hypothetical protein